MADYAIRAATLADAENVFSFILRHGDLLVPRSLGNVVENIDRFFVAEVEGTLVGCAAYQVHPEIGDVKAATVEIQSVAVEAAYRKLGIGRALIEAVVVRVAQFGPAEVLVLTFAPAFFAKLGFHEIPKTRVMHKLYTGCINCTKHTNPFTCPEIAMKRDLPKNMV